jgi:Restriction endonuclease fold toxin 9
VPLRRRRDVHERHGVLVLEQPVGRARPATIAQKTQPSTGGVYGPAAGCRRWLLVDLSDDLRAGACRAVLVGGESAATAAGRSAHLNYANALGGGDYVFNRALPGSRLRPDAVSYSQRIVRELKPDTPSAISEGWRQVNDYKAYLEELTGQSWTAYVDVYTP